MKWFWTLKKAIISSIATTAFALAGAGLVHAQTGAGATTGTPSQGASGMQSAPSRWYRGTGGGSGGNYGSGSGGHSGGGGSKY